jgi:hypothetical protein
MSDPEAGYVWPGPDVSDHRLNMSGQDRSTR